MNFLLYKMSNRYKTKLVIKMPNKDASTVCGVRVAVWGAQRGDHFTMKHQVDQVLFGGNCGHAAVSLTLPANEKKRSYSKNTVAILPYQ